MKRANCFVASALAACAQMAVLTWVFNCNAADLTLDPETSRILDTIEQTRQQRLAADRQAAHRLNNQGDRAYRRGDYQSAFTAYANSYPNYPTAYAYIMAGDTHWRSVVRVHDISAAAASSASSEPSGCLLTNAHFTHDLSNDLAQHYAVGLELAKRDQDRRLTKTAVYRRASEAAACLHVLGKAYAGAPAQSCVDVEKLKHCIGAPLLK